MDASLSELNIKLDSNVSELSDFDEIYHPMDSYGDEQISPAASGVSFSSWSFSPISGEESELQESASQQTSNDQQIVIQPIQHQQPAETGSTSQHTYNHGPVHQVSQHATVQQVAAHGHPTMHSEYMYPSNITYRHSVNIHNYVGNYCRRSPATWKEMYPWDVPSAAFTGFQPPMQHETIDQSADPLGSLNNPELEFTRCSTPEYLLALNSICQVDSPPNTSLFDESLSGHSGKQDSGYNSDLNVSPLIDYQDTRNKPITSRKHVSTPMLLPLMRYANIHNKETVPPIQRRLIPPRFTMSMPGFTPKSMYVDRQSANCMSVNPVPQQAPVRQDLSPQVPVPSFQKTECGKLNFLSVADYHAKQKESQMRQKPTENKVKRKCASPVKHATKVNDDETDISQLAKRRRHNEPLNNVALDTMQQWYLDNQNHPYPSKDDKEKLAKAGSITVSQVKSWFANKRNRSNNTRPKKQKRVMEEKLLGICHQLARDAQKPNKDNAYYIQQLSSIIDTTKQ